MATVEMEAGGETPLTTMAAQYPFHVHLIFSMSILSPPTAGVRQADVHEHAQAMHCHATSSLDEMHWALCRIATLETNINKVPRESLIYSSGNQAVLFWFIISSSPRK